MLLLTLIFELQLSHSSLDSRCGSISATPWRWMGVLHVLLGAMQLPRKA